MKLRNFLRLTTLTGFLFASALHADVSYTYTGNLFNHIDGEDIGLTPSSFISVTLTFSSTLAGNLNNSDVTGTLTHYSFTDGTHTISDSGGPDTPAGFLYLQVSTDAWGDIVPFWRVYASGPVIPDSLILFTSSVLDTDGYYDLSYNPHGPLNNHGFTSIGPGSWQMEAPEPATTVMFAGAGLLLALGRKLRRRP